MADNKTVAVGYTAREEYLAEDVASNYVANRFSGRLGRYRHVREQSSVDHLIAKLPAGEINAILDCPVGIGRWMPNLSVLKPKRVVGMDVSPTMIKHAQTVKLSPDIKVEFREGVAENMPFADGEFDLVFCHALLKHLPLDAQRAVIIEIARVTSKYAIITSSVNRGAAGFIRRFRHAKGAVASSPAWFDEVVRAAGFEMIDLAKTATPIGVEYGHLLRKVR